MCRAGWRRRRADESQSRSSGSSEAALVLGCPRHRRHRRAASGRTSLSRRASHSRAQGARGLPRQVWGRGRGSSPGEGSAPAAPSGPRSLPFHPTPGPDPRRPCWRAGHVSPAAPIHRAAVCVARGGGASRTARTCHVKQHFLPPPSAPPMLDAGALGGASGCRTGPDPVTVVGCYLAPPSGRALGTLNVSPLFRASCDEVQKRTCL